MVTVTGKIKILLAVACVKEHFFFVTVCTQVKIYLYWTKYKKFNVLILLEMFSKFADTPLQSHNFNDNKTECSKFYNK